MRMTGHASSALTARPRQLYDMQRGNRNGAWTPLTASVVAHLGAEDLSTAAAYLASLKP
jgi:hypothetical protein